jgi:hypothetical protein
MNMRAVPLSVSEIESATPVDKPLRLFDGGGLYLEIVPAGGKPDEAQAAKDLLTKMSA